MNNPDREALADALLYAHDQAWMGSGRDYWLSGADHILVALNRRRDGLPIGGWHNYGPDWKVRWSAQSDPAEWVDPHPTTRISANLHWPWLARLAVRSLGWPVIGNLVGRWLTRATRTK